jgi:hypothetical protein
MTASIEETRFLLLNLLDKTRRETRETLSGLDPERLIHTDERAWRVRDIVGHLGVWNEEAARSIRAFAKGEEYYCIPTDEMYYDYNGPAAEERRTWTMDQVWDEYETAHDKLRLLVETLPEEKWEDEMVFPWNERGTITRLIIMMMDHEKTDHCDLVVKVST